VLLDGQRVVGAALDGRVVGDDDAECSLHPSDAGHDARARGFVVIQAVGRKRAQFQEGRSRIDQAVDPLSDRQLAPLPVAVDRAVVAAGPAAGDLSLLRS
jgi:hypothetical protein